MLLEEVNSNIWDSVPSVNFKKFKIAFSFTTEAEFAKAYNLSKGQTRQSPYHLEEESSLH